MVIFQDALLEGSERVGKANCALSHRSAGPTVVRSRRLDEALLKAIAVLWEQHRRHGWPPRERHRQSACPIPCSLGRRRDCWVRLVPVAIRFSSGAGGLYSRNSIGDASIGL